MIALHEVSSSWFEISELLVSKNYEPPFNALFLACCNVILGSDILLRSVLKQPFNVREEIHIHKYEINYSFVYFNTSRVYESTNNIFMKVEFLQRTE